MLIGINLAILDVDDNWDSKEQTQQYIDVGMFNVAFVVDGKDIQVDTIRGSSLLSNLLFSPKSGGSAVRVMTFSSKTGLVVDFSCLCFVRASETSLMSLWGSYSGEIPLASWGAASTDDDGDDFYDAESSANVDVLDVDIGDEVVVANQFTALEHTGIDFFLPCASSIMAMLASERRLSVFFCAGSVCL